MIEKAVDEIYSLLVQGRYSEVEALTNGHRLSAQEIGNAISEYGRTLTHYSASRILDIIEIEGTSPKSWSVVAPVYTQEEGLSDLSIEVTIIESGSKPIVELDNIHVR